MKIIQLLFGAEERKVELEYLKRRFQLKEQEKQYEYEIILAKLTS